MHRIIQVCRVYKPFIVHPIYPSIPLSVSARHSVPKIASGSVLFAMSRFRVAIPQDTVTIKLPRILPFLESFTSSMMRYLFEPSFGIKTAHPKPGDPHKAQFPLFLEVSSIDSNNTSQKPAMKVLASYSTYRPRDMHLPFKSRSR